MSEPEYKAAAIELSALKIVVRALAKSHARRLEDGGADLLESLKVEAMRLVIAEPEAESPRHEVLSALNSWIETLKGDAAALGDLEARDASGRSVHFVD
jgi:hypothetical protein